jgi:circadian clock protein KaiC
VIIDPISSLVAVGSGSEVRAMLVRLIDLLKGKKINGVFTALTHSRITYQAENTEDAVSSLADIWIRLTNENRDGQLERHMQIIKSRGMGHHDKVIPFVITNKGFKLTEKTSANIK